VERRTSGAKNRINKTHGVVVSATSIDEPLACEKLRMSPCY